MEPMSWTCGSAVLTMFVGTLCLIVADTATEQEKPSPPSNLMATVNDIFVVNWTWDAPTNLPSVTKCDLKYKSHLNDRETEGPNTFHIVPPDDLNEEMCFKVKSVCKNENKIKSESIWVEKCTSLLKGDLQPPVKDFTCSWTDGESMKCTWHLGEDTPPDTNYMLIYRSDELNKRCQAYTYEEGVVTGCTFINETFLNDKINILITDSAMTLGRFYMFLKPISFLKPPPLNINVSKIPSNRIHVAWNDSKYFQKDYEVQWKESKSETWTTDSVSGQIEYTTDSINPDSKYTVRVRSKFDRYYGGKLWSGWSTEATIGEHREDEWTLNFILLFTIPLAVAAVTILLLVLLKRIRVFILPPIPDPGKLLIRMFPEHSEERKVRIVVDYSSEVASLECRHLEMHWIQHVSAMYPENPTTEEICSVILLETDTSAET